MPKIWHADSLGHFQLSQICFIIFFHIPSPGGTPKNDPLEDVTKFGMKNMSKLSLTESIFITERLNFYLNFLRTSLNLGKKLHLSICLRFYVITGRFFEKNCAMISHIACFMKVYITVKREYGR